MNTFIYTLWMVILWVLNLVKSTGLGQAYHILEYTKLLLAALAIFCALIKLKREKAFRVTQRLFFSVLAMTVLFVATSWWKTSFTVALDYLWSYLIVAILAAMPPSKKALQLSGLAYALMGLVVLAVYVFTDTLKGWDGNSVAMVGFSSFLIFIIPYFGIRDTKSKLILTLFSVLFMVMFQKTASRSCILAASLGLLLFFNILPSRKLRTSPRLQFLIMLIPLLVALAIMTLSTAADLTGLNAWSMEKFSKPIFNGRDTVWLEGFQQLQKSPLFGSGRINGGYWHNSALACLTAYGCLGYFSWVHLFHYLLSQGNAYSWDVCVSGSTTAFIVFYLQQSVELGLFAPNPNLLPYAMLGILLGRVNYLRRDTGW